MSSAEAQPISEDFSEGRAIEAPRFSCSLGGALGTAVGIYGTVRILHSGAGVESASSSGSCMPVVRMPEVPREEPVHPVLPSSNITWYLEERKS
jgi:hypothetical protein